MAMLRWLDDVAWLHGVARGAARVPGKPGTCYLSPPLDHRASGARRFATETPNLLNVAVSRVRRRFYVIGNRGA